MFTFKFGRQSLLITLLIAGLYLIPSQLLAQLPGVTPTEDTEEEPEIPVDVLGRTTPQGTVRGFITAVAEQDYTLASRYLNLNPDTEREEAERMAVTLQRLLNRGSLVAYARISNDAEGYIDDELAEGIDRVGMIEVEGEAIEVLVERIAKEDGTLVWKFSNSTVVQIPTITEDSELLVDRVLPEVFKENLWWGVPVGHWLVCLILIVIAYLLAWAVTALIGALIPRVYKPAGVDPVAGVLKALMLPLRLYLAVWLFVFLSQRVGISIILRQELSALTVIVGVLAILILLWRLSVFLSEFSRTRMIKKGNAAGVSIVMFLKRAAKITIIVLGAIAILGVFGIDVTAGLAALGIGGLALALGAQKTIENFVGSVTLITDQPIRVGDFCKVGDVVGTVERIGMRSTRIRTLNRTIVTIPNGEFSSNTIENYAHRDSFWFHPVIGLRYETTPEQIRFLLVELRAVLYAHPKVNSESARVRFIGLGSDSLNMEVFSYIAVATYDEYLEVQEDLLLRFMDVIKDSGTDFAFPSQTIYFARDSGLSKDKSKHAEEVVKKWRERSELQLPSFSKEQIEKLEGSIPYPPEGSIKRKEEEKG